MYIFLYLSIKKYSFEEKCQSKMRLLSTKEAMTDTSKIVREISYRKNAQYLLVSALVSVFNNIIIIFLGKIMKCRV